MASYSTHPGGPSGALPARSAHDEPNRKGTNDPGTVLGLIATGALAATAIGVATARARQHDRDRRPPDDAPARTAVRNRMGDYALVGKTVTINKPKAELYAFFRDFQNLPKFMENVRAITPRAEGDATRHDWQIRAPGGRTVDVITEVTEDREGEMIGWRSVEGSDIKTTGHVAFKDAPAGRGTEVELVIAYDAPFGAAGRMVAKVMQAEPHIQARRDLKRFKMLMETGEIATSQMHP
ncbi:SRPBCC family protein [Parvularcula dongshanensis]|uniref:Putative membrane protein n=1 Tax=Parvularcula dongshanensis TaxID=1173995 RepID=A0A840I5K9_9PROT|nr:SRPBCC family protein [Parvularcula dongshanensis]MBB4659605.1 putative membrane protein [Parvularcula dongshanensis]